MPKVVACGSRDQTFRNLRNAVKAAETDVIPLLLVDSEGPVQSGQTAWTHLTQRDKWDKPSGVRDDQAHLMVQCMESWFLADPETLADYFGKDFQMNALPKRVDIEHIPKRDVFAQLANATRKSNNQAYGKGKDSFALLAAIDAAKVMTCSPFAQRLINVLKGITE